MIEESLQVITFAICFQKQVEIGIVYYYSKKKKNMESNNKQTQTKPKK